MFTAKSHKQRQEYLNETLHYVFKINRFFLKNNNQKAFQQELDRCAQYFKKKKIFHS